MWMMIFTWEYTELLVIVIYSNYDHKCIIAVQNKNSKKKNSIIIMILILIIFILILQIK